MTNRDDELADGAEEPGGQGRLPLEADGIGDGDTPGPVGAPEAEKVAPVDWGTEEPEEPAPRRRRRREPPPEPDYPFESDPAPVVTDEGVYGRLPEPRTLSRLRDYERGERPARERWARLAAFIFALSLGLWLVLYSAAQVTSERVAVPAIERTVEAMTGLGALLDLHAEEISQGADDPATIPGYSVPGVSISRAEVRAGGTAEWHALLLRRTAEEIYRQGPGILAGDGEQNGAGTFSTAGGARRLMETLSEGNHGTASTLLWPVALVALASMAGLLAVAPGFTRFSALGFALLLAAVPPVLAGLLGMGFVAFIGSDGSSLAQETSSLAGDLAKTPLRNGLTVALMGIAIVIPARIAGAVFGRSRTTRPVADTSYDAAYD